MGLVRFGLALVFAAITGCQQGDSNRVSVIGTVELRGEPVALGSIALRPMASIEGPAAGAEIVDGNFSIPQPRGPTVGPYLASVTVVMPVDRNIRLRSKFAKFAHVKFQTFEVPLRIKPNEAHYDISLPVLTAR